MLHLLNNTNRPDGSTWNLQEMTHDSKSLKTASVQVDFYVGKIA